MTDAVIRPATADDREGAYRVCLKTGDHGADGEALFADDPDALGRIYVGPYLAFEPDLSLILEDAEGVCGYALGAFDSRTFYEGYEREWRPQLCARFPEPTGDPAGWTQTQHVHHAYHHPDYFCPEPYAEYPSHLHIDLLPRAQRRGYGRRMVGGIVDTLQRRGSPGAHLGVSTRNAPAQAFYHRLGFHELTRTDGCLYLGRSWK